jgi:hypothetical protein
MNPPYLLRVDKVYVPYAGHFALNTGLIEIAS